MIKKIISLFTLTAFVVFTFSCYSIKKEKIETVVSNKGTNAEILALLKKSRERIEFPKGEPGRIFGDKIVGEAVDEEFETKPVSIPISDVYLVWVKKADSGKIALVVQGRAVITISVLSIIYLLIWLIKNIGKH
jgi:hypothetical protein